MNFSDLAQLAASKRADATQSAMDILHHMGGHLHHPPTIRSLARHLPERYSDIADITRRLDRAWRQAQRCDAEIKAAGALGLSTTILVRSRCDYLADLDLAYRDLAQALRDTTIVTERYLARLSSAQEIGV